PQIGRAVIDHRNVRRLALSEPFHGPGTRPGGRIPDAFRARRLVVVYRGVRKTVAVAPVGELRTILVWRIFLPSPSGHCHVCPPRSCDRPGSCPGPRRPGLLLRRGAGSALAAAPAAPAL